MVKFVLKAGDFKSFLETVCCEGTLQFNTTVKAPLFSAFFIDADKDKQKLSVLTIDTFFIQIKQDTSIKAKVLEAGVIEVTNYKRFKAVFEGLDLNKTIKVTSDDDAIYIESEEGDWYKLRIIGDEKLDEVYEKKGKLFEWREIHDEIEVDEKRKVWRITLDGKSALYPMKIKTTKEQLKKFVGDTMKLTKESSTVIISEKGQIDIHSGAPNASSSSKHPLQYTNVGKELINFSVKFAGLQAIVSNLLDDIYLSFRKTSQDTIVLRIESFDNKIHQIISIGSEDKDGVLWNEQEEEIE